MLSRFQILLGQGNVLFQKSREDYRAFLSRHDRHLARLNLNDTHFSSSLTGRPFDEEKYLFLHRIIFQKPQKAFKNFEEKYRELLKHSSLFSRLFSKKGREKFLDAFSQCRSAFHAFNGCKKSADFWLTSLIQDLDNTGDEKGKKFFLPFISDAALVCFLTQNKKIQPRRHWKSFLLAFHETNLLPEKYALAAHQLAEHKSTLTEEQTYKIIEIILQMAQLNYIPAQLFIARHYLAIEENMDTLITHRLRAVSYLEKWIALWLAKACLCDHQLACQIDGALSRYLDNTRYLDDLQIVSPTALKKLQFISVSVEQLARTRERFSEVPLYENTKTPEKIPTKKYQSNPFIFLLKSIFSFFCFRPANPPYKNAEDAFYGDPIKIR